MIDSIIRDVLRDAPGIEVVSQSADQKVGDYDVLVLNTLDDEPTMAGYNTQSPSAGIVMVGSEGRTATIFRRLSEELSLEKSPPIALERAIMMAAKRS